MRSRVFEDALIHMKIQATLHGSDFRESSQIQNGNFGWTAEEVLRKESLEVIGKILLFCKQPQSRTSIMHGHNMNGTQFRGCLHYMQMQGLLAEAGCEFVTTKKGETLLELFGKLRGFFGVDQLE